MSAGLGQTVKELPPERTEALEDTLFSQANSALMTILGGSWDLVTGVKVRLLLIATYNPN